MLIRNFAGLQGLSVKAGRQYVVSANQSLFGAFDWSNTGFSHDGVMLQYSTKAWDTYAWLRSAPLNPISGKQCRPALNSKHCAASTVNNWQREPLIPTYSFSTTR